MSISYVEVKFYLFICKFVSLTSFMHTFGFLENFSLDSSK